MERILSKSLSLVCSEPQAPQKMAAISINKTNFFIWTANIGDLCMKPITQLQLTTILGFTSNSYEFLSARVPIAFSFVE
jgi:hypothetical protein